MKTSTLVLQAVLGFGAAIPLATMAAPCDSKVGKESVCAAASKLAALLKSHLPATEGMVTLETAKANKNVVTMGGKFDLDKDRATEFLAKNKLTLKQFEDTYAAQMGPRLCSTGSQTRAFIDGGGALMYAYTYRDGKPFMRFGVTKCA